jgi:hypothetical protein
MTAKEKLRQHAELLTRLSDQMARAKKEARSLLGVTDFGETADTLASKLHRKADLIIDTTR